MKLAIALAATLASCSGSSQTANTHETSACETACEHWSNLGCDIAEPDEDGNGCVLICKETQEGGLIDLEPEKATESDTCPE